MEKKNDRTPGRPEGNENNEQFGKEVKKMYKLVHKSKGENSPPSTLKKGSKASRKERRKVERARLKMLKKSNKYFEWQGIMTLKPENGLKVLDKELNLILDADIDDELAFDKDILKTNAQNGDFLIVLNRVDTSQFKYVAFTVRTEEILKAREQRFHLAFTGGDSAVVSLIKRGLKGKIDKRLKDPKKIIDRYKEDFLSTFDFDVILRDISRLIKNL